MWSLCQKKFSHSYSIVLSQRYPTLHCQQCWLFFDNHFHWLVEVWVRPKHPYRPLSLSVPLSLSLSCASLKCSHLVCIWGCVPQNLSLHKHSEWVCLSPSIHISCSLHLWILVYSVHIHSLWLARLTAKKMPLFPLLLLLVVVTQGSFLPKVQNGCFCIFNFSLVAICFLCVWWTAGPSGCSRDQAFWLFCFLLLDEMFQTTYSNEKT